MYFLFFKRKVEDSNIKKFIETRDEISIVDREKSIDYIRNILKFVDFINIFDSESEDIEKVILLAFFNCIKKLSLFFLLQ